MSSRHLDEVVTRQRAAALAGHTGDDASARKFLSDPDATVRATALGALNRLNSLTKSELIAATHDENSIVRRRACTESTSWNGAVNESIDADVAAAIAWLLDDSDDSVIEIAAWACGERPPAASSTIERLCSIATAHEDALCRESAVAALGALSDPAGLNSILVATKDKATVRRRALIALAPFEGPEVDAALERGRSDRDWQVRQAAEDLSP
ncbi:MAG: HEAT repeat domain-containing protein [Acidimicrobiales bacterium]